MNPRLFLLLFAAAILLLPRLLKPHQRRAIHRRAVQLALLLLVCATLSALWTLYNRYG